MLFTTPIKSNSSYSPFIAKANGLSNLIVRGCAISSGDGHPKSHPAMVRAAASVPSSIHVCPLNAKMIPRNWVSLIAYNKLLSPQKTMKPSSRGAISSRLTALRASTQPFPNEAYSKLVNQLKEMQ